MELPVLLEQVRQAVDLLAESAADAGSCRSLAGRTRRGAGGGGEERKDRAPHRAVGHVRRACDRRQRSCPNPSRWLAAEAHGRGRGARQSGTRYTVYVTNGGKTVKAGTVTINARGEGEIELKNYDGKRLPAGVAPVGSITSVTVKDAAGKTILSGFFT